MVIKRFSYRASYWHGHGHASCFSDTVYRYLFSIHTCRFIQYKTWLILMHPTSASRP